MALSTVIDDILWNLDTLSKIENHQCLAVTGDRLCFDARYLQAMRRTFSGDSRNAVTDAIKKTFQIAEEVLHSYQCNYYLNPETDHVHQEQLDIIHTILEHIQAIKNRRDGVVSGLKTLSTHERYVHDNDFQIKVKRFSDRMGKLADRCGELMTLIQTRCAQMVPPMNRCCFAVDPTTKPPAVDTEDQEDDV